MSIKGHTNLNKPATFLLRPGIKGLTPMYLTVKKKQTYKMNVGHKKKILHLTTDEKQRLLSGMFFTYLLAK